MTSAPRSASTWAPSGPATKAEKSRTAQPAEQPAARRPLGRLGARTVAGRRRRRAATPRSARRPRRSSWPPSVRGNRQPDLGRCGSASASPGASTGSQATPAARSSLDPHVARLPGEERAPPLRPLLQPALHLVGVVALDAGLVAEHLDELGVHALAAEPHLDQLAVGAAVQEVGEGRALSQYASTSAGARSERPIMQPRVASMPS